MPPLTLSLRSLPLLPCLSSWLELESVCVEAFYLEQGLMDQRAFAAAFDATFVQARPGCTAHAAHELC